jgi:hypothetical protein
MLQILYLYVELYWVRIEDYEKQFLSTILCLSESNVHLYIYIHTCQPLVYPRRERERKKERKRRTRRKREKNQFAVQTTSSANAPSLFAVHYFTNDDIHYFCFPIDHRHQLFTRQYSYIHDIM